MEAMLSSEVLDGLLQHAAVAAEGPANAAHSIARSTSSTATDESVSDESRLSHIKEDVIPRLASIRADLKSGVRSDNEETRNVQAALFVPDRDNVVAAKQLAEAGMLPKQVYQSVQQAYLAKTHSPTIPMPILPSAHSPLDASLYMREDILSSIAYLQSLLPHHTGSSSDTTRNGSTQTDFEIKHMTYVLHHLKDILAQKPTTKLNRAKNSNQSKSSISSTSHITSGEIRHPYSTEAESQPSSTPYAPTGYNPFHQRSTAVSPSPHMQRPSSSERYDADKAWKEYFEKFPASLYGKPKSSRSWTSVSTPSTDMYTANTDINSLYGSGSARHVVKLAGSDHPSDSDGLEAVGISKKRKSNADDSYDSKKQKLTTASLPLESISQFTRDQAYDMIGDLELSTWPNQLIDFFIPIQPTVERKMITAVELPALIGRNVLVYWPGDSKYYEGTVKEVDSVRMWIHVLYLDGNYEWEKLYDSTDSSEIRLVGPAVWARQRASPFWPAKLCPPLGKISKPDDLTGGFVLFEPTDQHAWIPYKMISPFRENLSKYGGNSRVKRLVDSLLDQWATDRSTIEEETKEFYRNHPDSKYQLQL
eukprot:GILJ01007660.1.p1 GENE.GILJ01007660.1~~GILJ01007660.1.p1  ORF type:complete len:591 (-),score=103.47 GILJ01007660.1:190-1962(-)